jgi:hypothetical protein
LLEVRNDFSDFSFFLSNFLCGRFLSDFGFLSDFSTDFSTDFSISFSSFSFDLSDLSAPLLWLSPLEV